MLLKSTNPRLAFVNPGVCPFTCCVLLTGLLTIHSLLYLDEGTVIEVVRNRY